jgi:hypothetical protein
MGSPLHSPRGGITGALDLEEFLADPWFSRFRSNCEELGADYSKGEIVQERLRESEN